MSTNATISVVEEDGSVKQIYLHWDGYISGAGKILFENYGSKNKVEN